MTAVVKLKDASKDPVENVVQVLENSLELARSGRLRSVCVVGDLTGNAIYTNFSLSDIPVMVGHLEVIKNKALMSLYEGATPISHD